MRFFDACKEVRPDETLPDELLKKLWAKGAESREAAERFGANSKA